LRRIIAAAGLAAGLAAAGAAAAATNGQQVYAENCAVCHQATGEGRPPTFPPLKGDAVATGPKAGVLAVVLNGRKAMPPWKYELTDDEIAAVVSYVRNAWGNKASAVTPADVAAVKAGKAPAGR
jgi:cytochrome c oxidase subunit 2